MGVQLAKNSVPWKQVAGVVGREKGNLSKATKNPSLFGLRIKGKLDIGTRKDAEGA